MPRPVTPAERGKEIVTAGDLRCEKTRQVNVASLRVPLSKVQTKAKESSGAGGHDPETLEMQPETTRAEPIALTSVVTV